MAAPQFGRIRLESGRAMEKEKDVVYLPGFWALIMLIIRSIPEAIFKKLSL